MSGKTAPAIAVPVHRYQQLQEAFVVTTARHCAERAGSSRQPRIFNPDDMFIDLIRWLWGELDDGMPVPQAQGEGLVIMALADHFHTVNAILAEEDSSETEDDDDEAARWGAMSLDDMLTGLAVAGLRGYLGQAGWDRLCAQARELIPAWTGLTAEGKPAHLMVPRQEPPAGKWDASADVTYSGRAREGWEDEENPLGQVTITEPGDVTRTFTHYPEHPDDPDHRELTWIPRQRPAGDRRAHPERRTGLRNPRQYRPRGGNAGRRPFADARGIHGGHRGEVPPPARTRELAAQPQCRTAMGQQVAGRERCERRSDLRNLISSTTGSPGPLTLGTQPGGPAGIEPGGAFCCCRDGHRLCHSGL